MNTGKGEGQLQVALGCDHAGLELKETVKGFLERQDVSLVDVGTWSHESCHYPEFAEMVARWTASGEDRLGILVCGTGVGMSIVANKVRGVRAAVCQEPYTAAKAREHNDANVLCLGARVLGPGLALSVVEAFLSATFSGGRHAVRLDLIDRMERSCASPDGSER